MKQARLIEKNGKISFFEVKSLVALTSGVNFITFFSQSNLATSKYCVYQFIVAEQNLFLHTIKYLHDQSQSGSENG
jgi:hypothetical protein